MHDEDNGSESAVAHKPISDTVNAAADAGLETPNGAQLYADALDYFLADENDLDQHMPEDDVEIKRFVNGQDKVIMTVRIRAIDDAELKQIRRRSKERGPRGQRGAESETDDLRFYTLLCAEAIVAPDLRSPSMLAKFKRPEMALERTLMAGERVALGDYILSFSGFGDSVSHAGSKTVDEIEAAKN